MLNIVLRTERVTDASYREVIIKSTKMEVFTDRIECYNDEYKHFEIAIVGKYFLVGHLPCCAGWEDSTSAFDFCTAYPTE